jgi:hypothetical protein
MTSQVDLFWVTIGALALVAWIFWLAIEEGRIKK